MISDNGLLLLLLLAIAIGWLLGRRSIKLHAENSELSSHYYKGLNYLLNNQPDGALDAFIEALEVNSETLETHIAVGNLMRRQGEVDRAIRVHQNLLVRPSLPPGQINLARLELARDFLAAGLFDRAERLLEELLEDAGELREVVSHHLLEIFQDQREWQQAIDTAKALLPKKSLLKPVVQDKKLLCALSHYCCELADQHIVSHDYHSARKLVKDAIAYDKNCVRASLLLAQVEYETANYQQASKALYKIIQQDPAFVSEALSLFKRCSDHSGGREAFSAYLNAGMQKYPSTTLMLALTEDVRGHEGEEAALAFLSEQLQQRPSLKGLATLLGLQLSHTSGQVKENLALLTQLVADLVEAKPSYQCKHCGFSGRQLHWLCPTCKQWGKMIPIKGGEVE